VWPVGQSDGQPVRAAIGWALPELRLPRDTALFTNSRTYGVALAPWRKAFEKLFNDRAPLLVKQRKNGQNIDSSDIRERFDENEAFIKHEARPIVQAFITASDVYQKCLVEAAKSDAGFKTQATKLVEANQQDKERVGKAFNALVKSMGGA